MKKNLFIKILLGVLISFLAYILFISYIISDGFRDYKNYCSQFIPSLDTYYKQHQKYPKTLLQLAGGKTGFNFRYSINGCGYQTNEKSYTFYYAEGFGVGGYNSDTQQWWID